MVNSRVVALIGRVGLTTLFAACLFWPVLGFFAPELTDPYPDTGISRLRTGLAVWGASLLAGLAEGYRWWNTQRSDHAGR